MKKKNPYKIQKELGERYRLESPGGESFTEYKKRLRKLKRQGL